MDCRERASFDNWLIFNDLIFYCGEGWDFKPSELVFFTNVQPPQILLRPLFFAW